MQIDVLNRRGRLRERDWSWFTEILKETKLVGITRRKMGLRLSSESIFCWNQMDFVGLEFHLDMHDNLN